MCLWKLDAVYRWCDATVNAKKETEKTKRQAKNIQFINGINGILKTKQNQNISSDKHIHEWKGDQNV